VCGADSQSTLVARINLASTYRSSGRLDEAIELFEENLRENVRVHGEDHQSTINARGELARSYVRAGRADDGIALHDENALLLSQQSTIDEGIESQDDDAVLRTHDD
jgi:lipopolysaccharide biosynthesis regulator YciM